MLAQAVVCYADERGALLAEGAEFSVVSPAVRAEGRDLSVGTTHRVRVERREEDDAARV